MTVTHAAQFGAVGVVVALDVVGLVLLNRHKLASPPVCRPWPQRRNAYWLLMAALISFACWLDKRYPIGTYMMAIKSYVFAFPVGLLDLHFSATRGVPLAVLAGASLWCSALLLRHAALDGGWPNGGAGLPPLIVHALTPRVALVEVGRYVGMLVLTGLLSDLMFSPLHRIMHHPRIYKALEHKVHHEYTTELTALVLYHGTLLDDFLMPFTTVLGGFLYVWLVSLVGLETEAFSNLSVYMMVCNTLMSHAHDGPLL